VGFFFWWRNCGCGGWVNRDQGRSNGGEKHDDSGDETDQKGWRKCGGGSGCNGEMQRKQSQTEIKHELKPATRTRLGHKLNTTDSEIKLCRKVKHGLDRMNPRTKNKFFLAFSWMIG